jgi:hypothetical protein
MAGAQRVGISGIRRLTVCILMLLSLQAGAVSRVKRSLLWHIHTYALSIDTAHASKDTYAYARATIRVEKRNPILWVVPSAYFIARGDKRQFLTETYDKLTFRNYNDFDVKPIIRVTNIPGYHRTLASFNRYMTPTVYSETLIGNTILSPFHPNNFKFYKYKIGEVRGDTVELRFHGRRFNTQLVRGNALVDNLTGRIIRCNFRCEYDMVHSWVNMEMGERSSASLFPKDCEALFLFKFMGNRVSAHYKSNFGLRNLLHREINNELNDPLLMAQVRPDTLDESEERLFGELVTTKNERDREQAHAHPDTIKKKENWAKKIFWDAVGNNVLNRVKAYFGQNNQGYLRINPLLNPLYMSYSQHHGFTYKIDIHASYQLGNDSEVLGRFRSGYSFGLKQFYFRVPLYYYLSRRKNRYIKLEFGNGNHISNNRITKAINLDAVKRPGDKYAGEPANINEFSQMDSRLVFNFDINSYFGFQVGILYQKYKAIHPGFFRFLNMPTQYSAFAPIFEIQYRPLGWSGPIFTADYDHGFTGVNQSNMQYDRYEFNAEYIHHLNRLQSLQMRLGYGFYSHKGRNTYFLNYENFRENNIPGGWNDDWSGEFELLRSENYDSSPYYVRGNFTYESPLLLLSWLPLVGHYMEMERIYVSWLDAHHIHPYFEVGYGFTTRLLSAGLFVSNGKGNRSIGCKFGFELFRHW